MSDKDRVVVGGTVEISSSGEPIIGTVKAISYTDPDWQAMEVFRNIKALLCMRYAADRCALGYYTHGRAMWPDNPFFTTASVFEMQPAHYEPGEALSVDQFVTESGDER